MNFATTYGEGEGKGKETAVSSESEEEEDYSEEQYPLADDKYKHLEERLNAMEIQKVPGLDFEELGLVSGIVIPPKFKVPLFAKYDGVSSSPYKRRLSASKTKSLPHETCYVRED